MTFSDQQIESLMLRLRQTPEELLYDMQLGETLRYKHTVKGASILGVAHCDYVGHAWSYPTRISPTRIRAGQVDDRVGVWLLLDILPKMPDMPPFDVLLTTDEEIGRSTAQEFASDRKYNWTFQFDRRGMDYVDYGMATKAMKADFTHITGIPQGVGSFSDICYLPSSCRSRINIGTGYHDEHTPDAFVDLEQCAAQAEAFVKFAKLQYTTIYPVVGSPRSAPTCRVGLRDIGGFSFESATREYARDADLFYGEISSDEFYG